MGMLTKAQARVLFKASSEVVMISSGFSEIESPRCISEKNFDKRSHIERLFVKGFLRSGNFANQFRITEAGEEALRNTPKSWQKIPIDDGAGDSDEA
jgi:hypothetical protein